MPLISRADVVCDQYVKLQINTSGYKFTNVRNVMNVDGACGLETAPTCTNSKCVAQAGKDIISGDGSVLLISYEIVDKDNNTVCSAIVANTKFVDSYICQLMSRPKNKNCLIQKKRDKKSCIFTTTISH